MAKTYTWSGRVAATIAALPERDSPAFWELVERTGDGGVALAPEVLAFLVRESFAHGALARAERLYAVVWRRFAGHVLVYARQYQARLQRSLTAEDVAVEVFALLCARLRAATDVTFYECCFLPGLKRLTLDKVQRLPDEPLVSLTVQRDEEAEEEQQDLEDPGAADPHEEAEMSEYQEELRAVLPARLHGLPPKVQTTAHLLMQGKAEGEIAAALGVSTRMVTNYKAVLRQALAGLT